MQIVSRQQQKIQITGFLIRHRAQKCKLYQMIVRILLIQRGVLDTTLCDKVCQRVLAGLRFYPGTPVSSTNKTDHDITEILKGLENRKKILQE
jgi:hypothetical protein